jgi:hypothetical protein
MIVDLPKLLMDAYKYKEGDAVPFSGYANVVDVLSKLSAAHLMCPDELSANGEGEITLEWHWHKGDWTKSIEEQERYVWDINIEVGDIIENGNDCMFFDANATKGVSKHHKFFHLYFKHNEKLPDIVIKTIKEFEEFVKLNTLK